VGGEVETQASRVRVPTDAWGPVDDFGYRYAEARISSRHADFPQWQASVIVSLRDRGGEIDIVGIMRPRE
jgi:hypothetical protein